MIIVNRIGDNITVSSAYSAKEYDVLYTEELFEKLLEISEKSTSIKSIQEHDELYAEVEELCKNDYKSKVEAFHSEIYVQPASNKFFLKLGDVVSSIPMPEALVRRIQTSMDKGINVNPIIKCWKRFLRNPKAGDANFAGLFAEYIDMTYIDPSKRDELIESGLGSELASERARVYEVKITEEGLLMCYKTANEYMDKFEMDEDGNIVKKDRYNVQFDPDTGKITQTGEEAAKQTTLEDRIFIPYVMGQGGDEFYCGDKLGHFIKVGQSHRLPDWSYVDCNDEESCVKGLHLGGLSYIASWGADIVMSCFVDPMNIGAICPYSGDKAMRVLEYYVHGSVTEINTNIYHSSDYAKLTDAKWAEIAKDILKAHGELQEVSTQKAKEVENL